MLGFVAQGFYRSQFWRLQKPEGFTQKYMPEFYRSQFWRLQKQALPPPWLYQRFIGHNFGDYKNHLVHCTAVHKVLSVTILETTKTTGATATMSSQFYRSQFWRLQKPQMVSANDTMKVRSYSAFQAE